MRDTGAEGCTSQDSKGKVQARMMQETAEEKELVSKKQKARRMQETAEEKEVHLEKVKAKRLKKHHRKRKFILKKQKPGEWKKYHRKRKFVLKKLIRKGKLRQKICESKGFIEDEQQ